MKRGIIWLILTLGAFYNTVLSQNLPTQSFEGFHLRQNTYPEDDTNYWNPNGTEVQGVTNDGENWFFTANYTDQDVGYLVRIPKSIPLTSVNGSEPGFEVIHMTDVPELANGNYWHWGDPDHYKYNGVDYILVPIPGPIIACFRADNLAYVNFAHLDPDEQDYAGWCAVGTDGDLYTSGDPTYGILRYDIDWPMLVNTSNHNAMTYTSYYELKAGNGSTIPLLKHMQGGEFSPSGELLYIVCGSAGCLGIGPGQPEPSDGIHVFETNTWKEIKRSVNSFSDPSDYFSYTFDNGCGPCLNTGSQTPEGLTIWDLDDGSAPYVRGQLHVLLDHYNSPINLCSDAITMYHYSRNVYVSKANGTSPPVWASPIPGTEAKPFKTVNEAYNWYPIWDGARMVIKAGTYSDTGIYNKRIMMTSEGGAAIIGQ